MKSYLLVLLNFRFFYLLIYFIDFPNFTVGWNYGNLTKEQYDIILASRKTVLENNETTWVKS